MNKNKHLFSFFYDEIKSTIFNSIEILPSKNIYRRISIILRMKENDSFILFNNLFVFTVIIKSITKKKIILEVIERKKNIFEGKREVNLYLPLLSREYMNEIFYIAGQQGISKIKLVLTEKTQQKTYLQKDINKFQTYMISGCEQGKQYTIPHVTWGKKYSLQEAIETNDKNNFYIFYEKANTSICSVPLQDSKVSFFCGPESGFSENEITIIKKNKNISLLKLSPFILRSVDIINFGSIFFSSI